MCDVEGFDVCCCDANGCMISYCDSDGIYKYIDTMLLSLRVYQGIVTE